MPTSLRFFDQTARVGSAFVDALAGQPVKAQYLDKVAAIYHLLARIHDLAATAAMQVSSAADMAQARAALQSLSRDGLLAAFRARHWCDELQALGDALRPLSGEALKVTDAQRATWDSFCESLQNREAEVARLYDEGLADLTALASKPLPLAELKRKADDMTLQLVKQKAQFDQLARKAEAMR